MRRRSPPEPRTGWTLLELLAVVAILGLLTATILPAVQQAREASRRADCSNRMRQIGLALHAFEQSKRTFPANCTGIGRDERGLYSTHVALLPYLELTALRNQMEEQPATLDLMIESWNTAPAWTRQEYSALMCPSAAGPWGTNYTYCTGSMTTISFARDERSGAFSSYVPRRAGEFRDGMSHTAALSEHLVAPAAPSDFDIRVHYWFSGASSMMSSADIETALPSICQSGGHLTAPKDDTVGWQWYLGSYGRTWYNHTETPNSTRIDCSAASPAPPLSTQGMHPPRSRHPQGVNVLAMDGSVHFVSDSIDYGVWKAMATIAGSEATESW